MTMTASEGIPAGSGSSAHTLPYMLAARRDRASWCVPEW